MYIYCEPKGNIDLHEWLGNGWGLLFSHPAPFTPICTSEVGALAKAHKVSTHWNIPKVISMYINSNIVARNVSDPKDHSLCKQCTLLVLIDFCPVWSEFLTWSFAY